MFERTLQDLIRGLRAHKSSSKAQEDAFIAEAMDEIRDELKGKDMALKAEGILKVCYLMMLYPVPPPPGFAFHVVEVMSSPRFHLKQLGYMAAPLAFTGDTEEVVLTINGIKKDLMSPHLALPPLPLTALPHLLAFSPSLSHTLHHDLLHLLTHSSPRVRKRAVLCLLPCWEAFPEGLREGFPRLRERLSDDDTGVVGATVGVVMELARRQGGKNYLPLAPELFGILTGSTNNWMLIKVVKLFAILTPLEPRLVRKLLPPITSLISSTSAISLLYECVRTCIVGGMLDPERPEAEALARVCVEKLGGYLRDEGGDQNLRYIALLAMVKIIPTHYQLIAEYQDEILQSLDDPDISIRMRALELVSAMVDSINLRSIVDDLLSHLAPVSTATPLPSAVAALNAITESSGATSAQDTTSTSARINLSPSYRLLLSQRILSVIAYDTYANVTDFEWVVSVLIDVAFVSKVDVRIDIRDLVLDIVGRVKSVRPFAVGILEKCLDDGRLSEKSLDEDAQAGLLEAAVWICGEYSSDLSSPLSAISDILTIIESKVTPPDGFLSIALQAIAKIFSAQCVSASSSWSNTTHAQSTKLLLSMRNGVEPFCAHSDIEVQERAVELTQLLNFIEADLRNHRIPERKPESDIPGVASGFEDTPGEDPIYPKSLFLLPPLFSSYELNAVALQAQSSIRPPEGLDLEHDFVPGGGFPTDLADDEGMDQSEDEGPSRDLGEGGSQGMEELRRVIRQQEEEDKERRRGKKGKGKGKKADGTTLTAEEKAEKAKRKAAKKAKAKEDPYYLYDEKEDNDDDDVDEIPIVQLDLGELPPEPNTTDDVKDVEGAIRQVQSGSDNSRPSSTRPIDIDRTGEMPSGVAPQGSLATSHSSSQRVKGGLAGVDLSDESHSRPMSSSGRYEEYTVDDEKVEVADEPVKDVEVVKVKRKKRKDGERKKKKEGVA